MERARRVYICSCSHIVFGLSPKISAVAGRQAAACEPPLRWQLADCGSRINAPPKGLGPLGCTHVRLSSISYRAKTHVSWRGLMLKNWITEPSGIFGQPLFWSCQTATCPMVEITCRQAKMLINILPPAKSSTARGLCRVFVSLASFSDRPRTKAKRGLWHPEPRAQACDCT